MNADEKFPEEAYLAANPDVALAVKQGHFKSGREHFELHGCIENRTFGGGKIRIGEIEISRGALIAAIVLCLIILASLYGSHSIAGFGSLL